MDSPPRRCLAISVLAVLLGLSVFCAAPARAQAPLPPSLTLDARFAPPQGIARDDLGGSATDIPSAIAVDGQRIYTVGEVRDSAGDSNLGIVARGPDGLYDTGFSGDGKLVLPIAAGTGKDVATDVVVLPDHRLRILASTDVDSSTSTSIDVAIVGLNPDGGFDTTFGAAGSGRVVFPAAAATGVDTPTRLDVGPDGRLAVTGAASDGSKEDLFVSLREANGAPVAGFGTNGVRVVNRAVGALNDRGVDVEFRPGGGIVALVQVETNPDSAINDYVTVLHAFDDTGADDGRFGAGGDLVLPVGQPDTVPGGLLAYGGMLWVSGATHVGSDTDAFVARLDPYGGGFESRRFDMRGTAIDPATLVVSSGSDLDVVASETPTLVVTGSINYNGRPYWAAGAFNAIDGPLAQAGYGDLLIPTDEYGAIVGLAPSPDGWAAIAGSLVDTSSNFDTSFGTARLLLDADKQCDVAVDAVEPLEITVAGPSAPVTLRVTNAGSRVCTGTVSVPAPYALEGGPVVLGPIGPKATATTSGLRLAYRGPRRRDDVVEFRASAPGDAKPENDTRPVKVLFSYCELLLRTVGRAPVAPTEGARRYELSVHNAGTTACRGVHVGVTEGGKLAGRQDRFTLAANRSASVDVRAAVASGARPGGRAKLTFRAYASGDAVPGNESATLTARLVGVGDSDVRGASARGFHGTARGGTGNRSRSLLRLRRVEVAVQRLGRDCRWLAGASGTLRRVRPATGGKCARRIWSRAGGTRNWRLSLRRALPPGSYVLYSRAVTGAGFREASFSARDRNRLTFHVP
jgi:hypothetical protein